MKKIFLSLLALPVIFIVSCNNDDTSKTTDTTTDSSKMSTDNTNVKMDSSSTNMDMAKDNDFAMAAADGGMAEVEMGKLTGSNASAKAVKDLGKMMIMDHGKGNDELKALAAKNNITLPATISDKHKAKYDELAAKKGTDFDKAYLDAMEQGHKETISKFEDEAANGKNADLKQWATEKLPTLRHHLETIQSIKAGKK